MNNENTAIEEQENTEDVSTEETVEETKRYTTVVETKKQLREKGNTFTVSSLENLSDAFDNERIITFQRDDCDDIVFQIRTLEASRLILETSSPEYFDFAQNLAENLEKDENYIQNLPQELQINLIKEDLNHKQEVVVQGVVAPQLGVNGSEGFPVEQLPSEILNELYVNILQTDEDTASDENEDEDDSSE